jgi:hypothetical protein
MAVRARFWVQKVVKSAVSGGGINYEVFLAPVVRPTGNPGGDGNIDWSKYTPSGEMRFVVSVENTGKWYEARIGKDISILMDDPVDAEPDAG